MSKIEKLGKELQHKADGLLRQSADGHEAHD